MTFENWWEDLELMRRLFRYDSETGLIYAKDRSEEDFYDTGEGSSFVSAAGAAAKYNKERSGKLAMNRRVKTERSTCYYLCGGISYRGHDKKMQAHRVAFFLHHGHYPQWPNSVDHINRDGCDNRIVNLREVTAREQSANTGLSKANTSGVKGVSFLKDKGKWRASMNIDGKKTNLGTFLTMNEAVAARLQAEKEFCPMTFELRDYQREAVDGLYNYWAGKSGDNPLIVAPTGSGKTAIIAQIVKDAMSFAGTRVMIVTHVKELLEQGANGLLKMYPEADFGVYSAGLKQKVLDRPITFAGIQSVWERAYDIIPAPDLILIDEAHMLPKNTETRYNRFIADLKVCNPAIKVVGLTATPYRLDTGYLHKGKGAIFDGIAHDIPIDMLMEQGYLSPVISKGGLNQIDLTNVKKRGGEFIESDLATAASDPELVRKTVEEIVELSEDRKSWLVFSSGVDHAHMLANEFEYHDIEVAVITGGNSNKVRQKTIADFKNGKIRCLINVNVLTTGFDHPAVDVVALVRATASAGLYVQMVGRGTRIAEGKTDALILDFGSNVQRLGFIDRVKPKDKSAGVGEGKAPVKQCKACQTMCFAAALQCHVCGHEFPPPTLNHGSSSYDGAMLSGQAKPEWVDVDSVLYHRHRKAGKPDSIKVTYYCGMRSINEWLCPDHGGYAASRYQARRSLLASGADTTDEAMDECHFWNWPSRIKIKPSTYDPKYFEVVQFDYTKVERKYEAQEGPIADWGVEDIPF